VLDYGCVPEHMRGGVRRYIENGIPPGHFLTAVLSNDFVGAIGRADEVNKERFGDWALFLYNELPGRGSYRQDCWGSREAVKNWIKVGGLRGLEEKEEDDGL